MTIVLMIMRRQGVSSERRHSSCSSLDLDSNFPKCFVPVVQMTSNVHADVQMMTFPGQITSQPMRSQYLNPCRLCSMTDALMN